MSGFAHDLSRELEVARAAASAAAVAIMAVYAREFDVAYKSAPSATEPHGDPVTSADRASNALIVEALAAAFAGDTIVAEESDLPADFRAARRCWFVDPLDGTRDFVQRNAEFCVMIGLAIDGVPRLGVVAVPALAPSRGAQAATLGYVLTACDARCELEAIGAPARALTLDDDAHDRPPTLVVSRSRREPSLDRLVAALGGGPELRCGSVGVKVANVLLGAADAYVHAPRADASVALVEGPKLWDACAPDAIVRAAGGRFTDLDGAAIDYRTAPLTLSRGLAAAAPKLHARIVEAWKSSKTRRIGQL